ncbi:hypothetical protein Rifp1Sym_at00100 [endosymbiont of Riftia pachyptila (vent Ph05)]|uniref:1-deoxy-D-xylulose-5-phosphate synthase n=1 Tax=endosymbiont of Riftia pachyptila (vent Ph05) TaxID=1048808 RepID=G2DBN5_9GAMM|nr:hypothetical protein Rifp1Sym_at00100 [endosymbiont of Riftia pachyptila (vent Ph05)]
MRLLNLGLPDRFIHHATQQQQLAECGLDLRGVLDSVSGALKELPASVYQTSA